MRDNERAARELARAYRELYAAGKTVERARCKGKVDGILIALNSLNTEYGLRRQPNSPYFESVTVGNVRVKI